MSVSEARAALETHLPEVLVRDRLAVGRALADWRPDEHPDRARRQLAQWRKRLERSHEKWQKRLLKRPEPSFPPDLPITARAEEIIGTIRKSPVVVIAGETGSGKTTQLPKMCLAAGLGVAGKIACTQPRRVAALSVSRRIAEELRVVWGREVGAKIRFTDRSGDDTYIKMMTDGMLLAEVQGDPELSEYDAVIIDEAHERSLNIDFLLGYLQQLRARRPDLKILITSATIDTQAFSEAFDAAPIIEVSGRTFPVEVVYSPIDELLEESGDLSVIDGVAKAVENIVRANQPGDILVFLPGEKDIREARGLLEDLRLGRAEILPLFGRLSNEEQQRIFAPTQARKIILATNIAETSLTIPGIRFVVDSGLARVSRYHAQTHTRRLPIEPIARSSADQRKGRAGRVSDGVCIRLYPEQDYLARPKYATPEILRSNLAEVILRMTAFRLGRIEDFPFLNPPSTGAIRAGYGLLQDLGALDEERKISPLGRELARLPCDPTVGRMLLQAREEGAVREVLVIASALSIQDPRERPADARDAADRMHRKFEHPESDFLTLLNIWDAYHGETERLTQGQLRKFCKAHFVSYLRMREWREIHQQLSRVLDEIGEVRLNPKPAEYFQVHRALLSGLLANVAEREQGNHYRATHQRPVMLFPGSGLFDKQAAKVERKKHKGQQKPTKASGKRTPSWIMCAEWMETSRLFGRTAARIEVEWVLDLGPHILRSAYSEPYYQEKGERVLVKERLSLYGLQVGIKRVGYARLQPAEATEIFIRAGLVAATLHSEPSWYQANQKLRAEIEDKQTRLRHASAWQLDERVYRFYARRLEGSGVGSLADLNRWLRENHSGRSDRLIMEPRDLLGEERLDAEAFPESVEAGGHQLPLAYHYKPGEEQDGATLKVPVGAFSSVDPAVLDWAVPGYLRQRIDHLLRGLPKTTRVKLHPLGEKVDALVSRVSPHHGSLQGQLTRLLGEHYGVRVWPDEWSGHAVPEHLRPRVEVLDEENQVVSAGRDWEAVRSKLEATMRGRGGGDDDARRRGRNAVWMKARERIERFAITSWNFPDFAREQSIGEVSGVPVMAYPGLERTEDGGINLRLFPSPEKAGSATPAGFRQLLEDALAKDLGWLQKELARELKRAKLETVGWIPFPALERHAWEHVRAGILAVEDVLPLEKARFQTAYQVSRDRLRGYPPRFVDLLLEITGQRRALRRLEDVNGARSDTFARLLPPDFLRWVPGERLAEIPRYLEALEKRIGRARLDPLKDREKEKRISPYVRALAELKKHTAERADLFWALEEYRVQVFAQEMGKRAKVSPKILDEQLAAARKREALPGGGEMGRPLPEEPASKGKVLERPAGRSQPKPAQRKLHQEDLLDLKSSLEKGLSGF